MAMLGENGREFILNAEATRQAENALGGSLSQDAILASLGAAKNTKRAWANRRKGMLPEADDGQAIAGGSLAERMALAAQGMNTGKGQAISITIPISLDGALIDQHVLNVVAKAI